MPEHLPGICPAYQRDRNLLNWDFILSYRIRFIKKCISTHLIKIIDAYIIRRTLILNDIIFPENPSDVFINGDIGLLFDHKRIDLHWFRPKLMLILKNQILPF